MRPTTRGFTLIELMIVIAIVSIIAAIAIPNLLESRKLSNEGSAIQSLRTIHTSQTLFKDRDHDHDGRYQFAGELPPMRGLVDGQLAGPIGGGPFLSGSGQRSGYWFGMIEGGDEDQWGCLAVPVSWGRSGDRAFFIDETGVIRFVAREFDPSNITPVIDRSGVAVSPMRFWPPLGDESGGGGSESLPAETVPAEPR